MRLRPLVCGLLSSCLVVATMPAHAEMIGSSQLLAEPGASPAERAQVESFLARGDVQEKLVAMGVDPAQASERVASLTDAELQMLSSRIDELPAGAGALELVVIVLLVLIVLELLGAINIFSKI